MKSFLSLVLTILFMINFNSAYAEENKIFLTPNNTKIIAIMDFENNTGKNSEDNIKKGLSDSMTNSLAGYKKLAIVERSRLKDAINELSLNQSGIVSTDNAAKIGKVTGSQYVLLGSVAKIGDIFEVSVRLVDVESSRVTMGRSVRCHYEEAILKSIDYLALEVANYLGEDISTKALEIARNDAESFRKPNPNWYLIAGGAAIVVGTIIGVVIVIAKSKSATTTTSTKIPTPIRNAIDSKTKNSLIIDFSGLNFSF